MEVTADEKVLVAMRDDIHCREALNWAIKEFGNRPDKSVCFLLTHVVTELRNTAGKMVKLSEADGPSVAVHICDRVLPYLEGLQDMCDDAHIPSTVHVLKNERKGEAIMEAATKLEATHIVLASVPNKAVTDWKTINFCLQEDKLPPGCSLYVIQAGKKLKTISSATSRAAKAGAQATPNFYGTNFAKKMETGGGGGGDGEGGDEAGGGGGGLTALELARQAYRSSQAAGKQPNAAPGGGGGGPPPKAQKKSAKPPVAAKARLEKKMQAVRDNSAGRTKIPMDQNPLLKNRPDTMTAEAAAADPALPRGDFLKYALPDLQAAMDHFWPNHVCGEGSYGVVYKGLLGGQQVAIKQLKNPDARAAMDEIEREVEVQKRIDHSNLVRLLGYCVEDRSLVYEFMSNGSLEDRLLCIGGSPPLLWPERCRIAMEVAAGLQHLHTRKPPIVHRDVKPANILLDDNFTAKLGDVGLARLMGDLAPGHSHVVRKSVIVGTEHYVDPEYLCARRGYLGPKSDVYSFGIVLLQMLVGEVPNLRKIDAAVDKEELQTLLDPRAGDWPIALAMDLANLGLWCAEMDRRDRPDLTDEVIPALMEICDAAAAEVVEWERKQEAAKEQARKEQEAKEAAAKAEAAKAEEAKRLKEQQEAAAKQKEQEERQRQQQQQQQQQQQAASAASGKGGGGGGAAAKESKPGCCVVQ